CGCPFGLSSETGLLVTISFSGSDRMDNLLKDHRWPTLRFLKGGYSFFTANLAHTKDVRPPQECE
ncbi:MAG: hypothetical protein ACHP8A_11970, partial [Terriglobales bacterium]